MSSILSYPESPLPGILELLYTSTPAEIREFLYVTYTTVTSIDEFQIKILRVLIIILCVNLLFISISWGKYGEKITERFMKPGKLYNYTISFKMCNESINVCWTEFPPDSFSTVLHLACRLILKIASFFPVIRKITPFLNISQKNCVLSIFYIKKKCFHNKNFYSCALTRVI